MKKSVLRPYGTDNVLSSISGVLFFTFLNQVLVSISLCSLMVYFRESTYSLLFLSNLNTKISDLKDNKDKIRLLADTPLVS